MPGFGDTIRLTDHNTLLVPFASARNAIHSSVLDMIGEYPFIRWLVTAVSKIILFRFIFQIIKLSIK